MRESPYPAFMCRIGEELLGGLEALGDESGSSGRKRGVVLRNRRAHVAVHGAACSSSARMEKPRGDHWVQHKEGFGGGIKGDLCYHGRVRDRGGRVASGKLAVSISRPG